MNSCPILKAEIKREYKRLYSLAFPEEERAADKRYKASEKGRAARKRYNASEKGRALGRLHCANRRARKRNAFVEGCKKEIAVIYARSAELRKQGIITEVDHIYPLGFGWHEPANLQIIYAIENNSKNDNPDYKPSRIFE